MKKPHEEDENQLKDSELEGVSEEGTSTEESASAEEVEETSESTLSDAQAAVEAQLAAAQAEAEEAGAESAPETDEEPTAVESSETRVEKENDGSDDNSALIDSTEADVDSRYSRNIRRILDIQLPVTVSFGSTERPLAEVLKLVPGAVLELDKWADEPVTLKVNRRVMAWGKVVDVDGYYGVEITDIVARADRIASLGGE